MSTCAKDSSGDTRLYTPCSSLTAELVKTCTFCGEFCAACCFHKRIVCHHGLIVYTDGSCTDNGKAGAVSGLGIAFGVSKGDLADEDSERHQFSIPVDDKIDPGGNRTSQRAELLAALHGLRKVCDYHASGLADKAAHRRTHHLRKSEQSEIVITTDSEYVVKGMTEWLPTWKRNNFRNANGRRPSNIDLFRSLDEEVERREREHDIKVKFWHVYREYNTIADGLAKRGSSIAARAEDDGGVEDITALLQVVHVL